MEKKPLLTAVSISMLLLSAVAGTQLVNLGGANPYFDGGMVPPDPSAKPPGISIFAPQNNTVYTTNTIPFSINVSLPESQKADGTALHVVYYEADWQQNRTSLFNSGTASFDDQIVSSRTFPFKLYFQYSQDLAGIPDGNHTIRVYANGGGSYIEDWYRYSFYMKASSTICFTIDTVPPEVFLSVENRSYYTTDVPLGFKVNEPNTQVTYSLDGQDNVTTAGNATLTNLSFGEHNVTVYAWDTAGNVGSSKTVIFTIEEPPESLPTTILIAPFASVAFVGAGLLVYFKKRKHGSGDEA